MNSRPSNRRRVTLAKTSKYRSRCLEIQSLERRDLLAAELQSLAMTALEVGPQLIAVRPDKAALLEDGDTLNIAPREINLLFKGGADLSESSINANTVRLTRGGSDGLLGTADDVAVKLGYVGLLNPGSANPLDRQQIVLRLASSAAFNAKSQSDQFPDDLYSIQIVGSGAISATSPLQNVAGEPFRSGTNFTTTFRLDRAAQVVSVVPQPVTRSGGVLSQAVNQIDVYFDNQRLDVSDAQNPNFYRLVNATTSAPFATPTTVVYDATVSRATLTFASIPEGTYRLDIGQATNEDITITAAAVGASDNNASFDVATTLGTVGTSTLRVNGTISRQNIPLPPLPGGEDDPGQRVIQREDRFLSNSPVVGSTPVLPSAIQRINYYFPLVIGTFDTSAGPDTGTYLNLITDTEKQIVRDIFEIYARKTGIEFVENTRTDTAGGLLSIGKGDLRALNPFLDPTGSVAGVGGPSAVVLNGFLFNDSSRFFGDDFSVTAFHEIGHALRLGHSYNVPSVQGPAPLPNEVLPGDTDLLSLKRISPPNSTDIDLYSFTLPSSGRLNAEIFAERLPTPSLLNGALALYRQTPSGQYELVARNDQYFGADPFLDLTLDAGTYFIGVSSTGNTSYDPNVPNSGFGGTTDGNYQLDLKFKPESTTVLRDTRGTALDGDSDGTPGGVYQFWFQSAAPGNTFFVDKLADTSAANAAQGTGTLSDPFESITQALNAAAARVGTSVSSPTLVRIVGNGGVDGNLSTLNDNRPYVVGTALGSGTPLADGAEFRVPQGVNVIIDAGALIKLRAANIEAGSTTAGISRAGGSIQVFGTPTHSVFLRSYHDDSVGGNSDGVGPGVNSGDFGGIVFRDDSDREASGIFLNYVNHADISHGGGQVFVDSSELPFTSIHITNARPTISYNSISLGNTAAISASPDSFDDSLRRIGPDVHGNYLVNNSVDGLFVRIDTPLGSNLTKLRVSGRFDDTDITHVLSENLIVAGGSGGPTVDASGVLRARPAGRLQIDPGVVVKLNRSRIELERGASTLIAEGTPDRPIVFTALNDKRYGGSGSFDTNRSPGTLPAAGAWGGLFFGEATYGSIDQSIITFGGGLSSIEGNAFPFNPIEIHQADVRIANSLIENNGAVAETSTNNRNGRGSNGIATIFVRGAQPIVVNNVIRDNVGSVISVNANSLNADIQRDYGRSTGLVQAFSLLDDNYGPIIRLNRLENNGSVGAGVNGLLVRGEQVQVESVWDDTDIIHVLRNTVTVDNLFSLGGLTLQSSNSESLVIKLLGTTAGFVATGTPAEIIDRIGGTIHVLGTVGHPVVFTSLNDDTVGAGFTPRGLINSNTNNSPSLTTGSPGDYRGLVFDEFSNDRNVKIVRESENPITNKQSINGSAQVAQFLGVLAPDQKSGDETRRLGFEVHGYISPDDGADVDVYSFRGISGTSVYIDIDRTDANLDAVVEVISASNGAPLFTSTGPITGANSLTQNFLRGGDFYTQNFRDPGFFYVLPGTAGVEGTYFVRVRSNTAIPAGNALSRGKYQLQIRTQQVDEFPGSTIQFADIRFAATGIDVQGLPAHSPLLGEAGETTTNNNSFDAPQVLVNLLETDVAALGISGSLSNDVDVDFYRFELTQTGVQAIAGGVNDNAGTIAVVFDIDYADGAVSADTTIAVYDQNQQLIYIGRESNVQDDQRLPTDTGISDLTRGSLGKKDGYIGPIHLTPGLDPLTNPVTTYYVAVMSNRQLPSALSGVFTSAVSNATASVRLEPVNSVRRMVEDHIGFQGYASGGSGASPGTPATTGFPVLPETTGGLVDISSAATLATTIRPFTLADVPLFIATDAPGTTGTADVGDSFYTANPFVSAAASTRLTNSIVGGFNDVQDIVVRSDGRIFGYQRLSGDTGSVGALVEIDPQTGLATLVGNDNINGQTPTPNVANFPTTIARRAEQFTTSDEVSALTFERTGGTLGGAPTYQLYYVVQESARSAKLYRATAAGDATPTVAGNGFVGDIQPTGVTYQTWPLTVTNTATPSVSTNLRIESKLAGTLGNAISINVTETFGAAVGVTATAAGNAITIAITRTGAAGAPTGGPTADAIVNAINTTAAVSALVTAVIVGSNPGVNNNNTDGSIAAVAAPGPGLVATTAGVGTPLAGTVTGLAFSNFNGNTATDLYGVTTAGEFIRVDRSTGVATVLSTTAGQNFQGLSLGPQNVEGGIYRNLLFAVTNAGRLYAFNTSGVAQTIFSGAASFITISGLTGSSAVPIGLAFSPLDFNLWHPTTRRSNDVGHGVNAAADSSRNPTGEDVNYVSAGGVNRTFNQSQGGASLRFGLEPFLVTATSSSQSYLTYGVNAQFGISRPEIHSDLSSNPAIIGTAVNGTYNLPGGALGAIETNTFDLTSTVASDRPTLYFNYFLDTENFAGTNANAANPFRDSARVWARRQGSTVWELLATNNSNLSGADPATGTTAELAGFLSQLSDEGLASTSPVPRPDSVQLRQELFDSTGQWRQARVDLSSFAGQENLQLRFDFSTAGRFGNVALNPIDSQFGELTSTTRSIRSLNNAFEGFYIDDIVVGYAERGEMVTGAAADAGVTDLNANARTRNPDPNRTALLNQGPYQLEIRRTDEYQRFDDARNANRVISTFDTNLRHVDEPAQTGLLADRNRDRAQGVFIIDSNFITGSSSRGINVQPGVSENAGVPHPGSLINFPQTNADRLIPGVVIQNNVIVGAGTGIQYASEVNAALPRPVPFGRIINNTIVGVNQTGTGVLVGSNASPTLLNNLFTDLATGIVNNGVSTIISSNFFQNNAANGPSGTSALSGGNTGSPFLDAANRNYILNTTSTAVDSSQNVEQDRADFVTFKQELGIPGSPIVSPDRDVYGQLRVDNSGTTSGGGSSVFKDRGAVDRSDRESPYAVLQNPVDNDASDRDPNSTVVHLTSPLLSNFRILLADGRGANAPFEGTGVNGLTVSDLSNPAIAAQAVKVEHNGVLLTQGVDYILGYNAITGVLLLTPLATLWEPSGVYAIALDNSQIKDLSGRNLRANQSDGSTKFFILMPDVRLDYGDAPASYSTLLNVNGSRHSISDGASPRLGSRVDGEPDALVFPASDDAPVTVAAVSPNAASRFTIAVLPTSGVSVTPLSLINGDQLSVSVGSLQRTFQFVSPGFAPQQGTIGVPLLSTDTPATIANRLSAAIADEFVFDGDGTVVSIDPLAPTTISIVTFDDEDGVAIGTFNNGTNYVVFLKESAPSPTTNSGDVIGFLNPHDIQGTTVAITASTNSFLDAWIDFNGDGAFDPIIERIFAAQPLVTGVNRLIVNTPAGTTDKLTWARFRISGTGNLAPSGFAIGGEVEDYQVQIINVRQVAAVDDTFAVLEDNVLNTETSMVLPSVFGNDLLDSSTFLPLRFFVEQQPTRGTLTITDPRTGRFVYTPAPDFQGIDTFTYWVSSQPIPGNVRPANATLATVTINVTADNDAPIFTMPPTFEFPENNGSSVVQTNFLTGVAPAELTALDEIERQGVSVTLVPVNVPTGLMTSLPTITVNGSAMAWPGTGTLSVFPAADAFGFAVYDVVATDSNDGVARSTTKRLTITINPLNDIPVAFPRALSVAEAVEVDGQTTVLNFSAANLLNGATGETPVVAGAFPGSLAAPYNETQQSLRVVRFTVPDASDVDAAVNEPGLVSGTGTVRRTTRNGSILSFTFAGGAFVSGTYTPPVDYNQRTPFVANESFSYVISDNGLTTLPGSGFVNFGGNNTDSTVTIPEARSVSALITLTVTPENDPPIFDVALNSSSQPSFDVLERDDSMGTEIPNAIFNLAPSAATARDERTRQSVSFVVQTALSTIPAGLMNSMPTFSITGSPNNWPGSASITVFPTADAVGTAIYVFDVVDAEAGTLGFASRFTRGTVTVNVRPVNDAPRIVSPVPVDGRVANPNELWVVDPATGTIRYTLRENNIGSNGAATPYVIDTRLAASVTGRIGLLDPYNVGPANEGDGTLGGSQTLRVIGFPVGTDSLPTALGGRINVVARDSGGAPIRFEYTPPTNFNSSLGARDSFTYTLEDDAIGLGETWNFGNNALAESRLTRVGRIEFTLNPVNNAPGFTIPNPVVSISEDGGPQSITGFATGIFVGPVTALDEIATQTVRFTLSPQTPENGLFAASPTISDSGVLTFLPAADAFGTIEYLLVAIDNGPSDPLNGDVNTSIPATITINVRSVNDAPSFTAGLDVIVDEDSGAFSSATPYATNIIPGPANEVANGQMVSFRLAVPSAAQALFSVQPQISPAGFLTFTPASNAFGTAVVSVTAVDSHVPSASSASVLLTITLREQNDVPVASDFTVASNEDDAAVIQLSEFLALAFDPDLASNSLERLTITDLPTASTSGASISVGTGGSIIYDPRTSAALQALRPGQSISDSFTYTLTDAAGAVSEVAVVTVTVAGRNDAPTTVNDNLFLVSNRSSILQPLANDFDVDGTIDPELLIVTGQPSNGSVSIEPNGTLIYTPRTGFNGLDTITYTVGDDFGQQSTQATITLDVASLPNPPSIVAGSYVGEPADIDLTTTPNPDGTLDFNSIVIVVDPEHGTVTIEADGQLIYRADEGFIGTDSFQYTISDIDGRVSDPVTVTVNTVNSRLQNPIQFTDVNADGRTTALDALLVINRVARSIRAGQGNSVPVVDSDRGPNFYDVDGNRSVTTLDALRVINFISRENRSRTGSGEGESLLGAPEIKIQTVEAFADEAIARFEAALDLPSWDPDDEDKESERIESFDQAWSEFSHVNLPGT